MSERDDVLVTIYWVGVAVVALWCVVGALRLIRETGDPGLAGAGILLALLWPVVLPLYLLVTGGEWFIDWLRMKTGNAWPWPFGKIEYPDV